MNREILSTIASVFFVIMLIVLILYFYVESEVKRLNNEIIKKQSNELVALSSQFELRLRYITKILEIAAQTHPIMDMPTDYDLISEQLKGIPEDADIKKREAAKILLDKKFDLDYVFYAMPNGDIYFLEPYSSQIKLSQLNFAFRDWYIGTISTNSTYVSEVYISSNEKYNVVGISVPMYSGNENTTLNGMLVGVLNLGTMQQILTNSPNDANEYFLIIDHNDNIIVDSRYFESDTEIRKFQLDLETQIKNNDVNMITETLDGKDMFISFKPMSVGTHTWMFVSIQPHDDVFDSSITLRNEAILIVVLTILIIGTFEFFLIRKINTNIVLTSRLKQTDVEKEEFSAMITHELKTPLVPIIGYCKMFKASLLGKLTDEQANILDVIEKNAKRLERLINDVLDAHKLDLNRIKFNITDVSIDEFFNDLNATYAQVLSQSEKEFIIDVQTKGLHIRTDQNRLRQVFDNLISNAIKFTPEHGAKITVGCKLENKKILLYVQDNGMGIPSDVQQFLFKKFYQIDTSERRPVGGAGLGLAICKGIVESLDGKIWVESDGRTGSIFYMKFNC